MSTEERESLMSGQERTPWDQHSYDIRSEWGEQGVRISADHCDVLVIVDLLSFTTCVTIAVACGAEIYPYRWKDRRVEEYAKSLNAETAGPRGSGRYSLSPASLRSVSPGTRLVLPSPNGATLSTIVQGIPVLAASLRNAAAVAEAAGSFGKRIAVIPAGERWPDGSLRPALEDQLGAGAVIAGLPGRRSPEAEAAAACYRAFADRLPEIMVACGSGRELIERGFPEDVALAAEINVEDVVPILRDGAYKAL